MKDNLGPLTKMNMERRASAEHAETQSMPWTSCFVDFDLFSDKPSYKLQELLDEAPLPPGWKAVTVDLRPAASTSHSKHVRFHLTVPATFSDGAQVRAILNLLK